MGRLQAAIDKMGYSTNLLGTKLKGDANSTIKTYYISGEELEKYRALPVPVVEKTKGAKIW